MNYLTDTQAIRQTCLLLFSNNNNKQVNLFFYEIIEMNTAKTSLSHDVASGSEIMPCIKIDKPQVVYRFR